MTSRYTVTVRLDWEGHVAQPGEVRDDLPAESVPWLLAIGAIVPAGRRRRAKGEGVSSGEAK